MSCTFLSKSGLRYNKNVIAPGAQTKRRDDAGPVRTLLGGTTSPAASRLLLKALKGLQSFFVSAGVADVVTGSLLRHSSALSFLPVAS